VIIRKVTTPTGGTGFTFGGDFGDFALNDGESRTVENLPAGAYVTRETIPQDSPFTVTSVSCADDDPAGGSSAGDGATRTAQMNLDPGETVTCTFTNSTDPTSLEPGVQPVLPNRIFLPNVNSKVIGRRLHPGGGTRASASPTWRMDHTCAAGRWAVRNAHRPAA
jgi:hypothetical protein